MRSFKWRLPALLIAAASASALALASGVAPARASNSDHQTLLSGTAVPTVFAVNNGGPTFGPFNASGYWIWSQTGGTNGYGPSSGDGAGNMYIYAFGQQSPVDVSNVTISGTTNNQVSETVTMKKQNITCSFWATETSPGHGWISYSCANVPVPPSLVGGVTGLTATVTSTNAPATVTISDFIR